MVELRRTVRFCLNGASAARPASAPRRNNFASHPPMRGLGRFYQLHVLCEGEPDPETGYFMNIKAMDAAVRTHVLPHLEDCLRVEAGAADIGMGGLLRSILERLRTPLNQSVRRIDFDLTPFCRLSLRSDDMDHVIIRHQYEFAAAHRLHVNHFSDEENRRVFGKCNNPSGHGHNYRLEVAVRAPIDPQGRCLFVEDLDAMVDEHVIEQLDHKHLNVDVPAFASLNPSVENIARVIHGMLADRVRDLGVELDEVTVWETGKTQCTYRSATPAPA